MDDIEIYNAVIVHMDVGCMRKDEEKYPDPDTMVCCPHTTQGN